MGGKCSGLDFHGRVIISGKGKTTGPHGLSQGQIPHGEDIRTMQCHDQVNVGGPGADTGDGGEPLFYDRVRQGVKC